MPERCGRRCSMGCETWPARDRDDTRYATCPRCGEFAKFYRGVEPLSEDEAKSVKAHLAFEEFYDARESRLGPLNERLDPLPLDA